MPSSSLGDDRHRFPFEDDVPGGQDGAVAAVGHGGARALPLAHPLLHQRLDRRRRGLRHHKLKFFSSGAPQKTATNNLPLSPFINLSMVNPVNRREDQSVTLSFSSVSCIFIQLKGGNIP